VSLHTGLCCAQVSAGPACLPGTHSAKVRDCSTHDVLAWDLNQPCRELYFLVEVSRASC